MWRYGFVLVVLLAAVLPLACSGGGDSAAGRESDDDAGPLLDDDSDDDVADDDTGDDDSADDDTADDDSVDDDSVDDDSADDDTADDDSADDDSVDDDTADDDTADDDTTGEPPTVEIIEPQDGGTYNANEQPVTIAVSNADTVVVTLDGNDVTDQLTITDDSVSGTVDGVTNGPHSLAVSVENPYGWDSDEHSFTTQIDEAYLDLTLSAYQVQVGVAVTRAVHVYDDQGNDITGSVTVDYDVQPSTGFQQSGDSFVFEELGTWTFSASCEYNGQRITLADDETISSFDHIPAYVTLNLSAHTVQAGATVIANTAVFNQFDEVLDLPVQIAVDPSTGVTINGAQITFTVTGMHTVTVNPAGYPAVTDSDQVKVNPGAAVSIALTLSDHSIDSGQAVDYAVTMLDQYGNVWTSGWSIASNPTNGVVIDTVNQTITFNKAGSFTISANYYTLHDYESVQVSDHVPPTITWTTPARGTFTQAASITLQGYVADIGSDVESLYINGNWVNFSDTGLFYFPSGLAIGYNTFTAVVTDSADNEASYTISVLRGAYLANDSWVENSVGAHVNQSGLEAVEDIAETYLNDEFNLPELVYGYNPLVNETFDLGAMSCSVYAEATDVANDPFQIDLLARNGYLQAGFEVDNFTLSVSASINCGSATQLTGTVSADTFAASLPIYVAVVDNQLDVTLGTINLTTTNFSISISGIEPALIDPLTAVLLAIGEDMINQIVQEEVPPLIEEALSSLELAYDFELLDHTISLAAEFESLSIAETGINLWMNARTTADAYTPSTPLLPGSFYTAGTPPTFTLLTPGGETYELGAGLSDDVLNQALYTLYRAGVLTMTLDDTSGFSLDLTAGDLELFFPGISDLYGEEAPVVISTEALLPPIIDLSPTDAATVELQLGEFFVDMVVQSPADEETQVLSMALVLEAPLTVDTNETGDALKFDIGTPTVNVDVTDSMFLLPDSFVETFVPTLVEFVLPFISSFLDEFPIPAFEGYSLNIAELTTIGALDDYLGVYGSLVVIPGAGMASAATAW